MLNRKRMDRLFDVSQHGSMSFTVADLLALPVMEHARVEVLAGHDLDARQVRWIHTSEIYSIAPLLQGGEVLMTTGLGLVGTAPEGLAEYVQALARREVAALFLELGRTFPSVPEAMLTAARDAGFPLVALHGVVPFIEVSEIVLPLLLGAERSELTRTQLATQDLHGAMLAGLGPSGLVTVIEKVCGGQAGLFDVHGGLVSGSEVISPDVVAVDVGTSVGPGLSLVVDGRAAHRDLVELCASALAVCLAGENRIRGPHLSVTDGLLLDLADESYVTSADITARARAVGFSSRRDEPAIALVLQTSALTPESTGVKAITTVLREIFGACLVGAVDGDVLAAVHARPSTLRSDLEQATTLMDAELRATVGGRVVRVVAGPVADEVAGLARSLPAARDACRMADDLGIATRVVLANDLGIYRLLSSVVGDSELERFINDQLGPLLEHDARTGSDLVVTLDAYLEAGSSKTAAAEALGIRRQTLYNRLDKIVLVLGGLDLDDRQRRTATDLALVSWRMRTAAVSARRRG